MFVTMIQRRPSGAIPLVLAAIFIGLSPLLGAVDILLPEVLTKGDVNLKNVSVTDDASWIWTVREEAKFVRFRCDFESDGKPFRIHVSADNRYTLYLDAQRIGRGPDRGYPEHWTFRSYELSPLPGQHRIEAVVSYATSDSPLAQLTSGQPGFLLRAEGDSYGRQLTTGRGPWSARVFDNITFRKPTVNAFGVGKTVLIDGDSPWDDSSDEGFGPTKVVRAAVGMGNGWGCVVDGPRLYPSTLPAQIDVIRRPGKAVAAVSDSPTNYLWRADDRSHPAVQAFNDLLQKGCAFEIPPRTTLSVLWDLEDYYCAYPELTVAAGMRAGLNVKWGWAESLVRPTGEAGFRAYEKANRDEFIGKCFFGVEDESFLKGNVRDEGLSVPWWRCGRWCRLVFSTGESPAKVSRVAIAETRYPIAHGWSFGCDDKTIPSILRICQRGLEMNSHEMSFDCPYYEQQMYGGDSRIQFLVHAAMSSDDRLVRRNIDLLDWSRRSDGRIAMNAPTRGTQDSTSFTFMWPMMLADYARWRSNRIWLRTKLPGLLHTMEGLRAFERDDGLLANLPGWNFIDWTTWPSERASYGEPKDVDRLSGIINLFYLYSLRSAAEVCAALDEPAYAEAFRRRFDRTAAAYCKVFWCEKEQMLSDTDTMDSFSQHSQALAIVLGVLSPEREECVRDALLSRRDLVPCTVSFRHYLFEAFAKMGRGDLILKELDLWRSYVSKGLKTGQEMPEPTRSDCHGWSSHPVYHLLTAIAGVTPAAPWFEKVHVAPKPGGLKSVRATVPTPKGSIRVDLRFDGKTVCGKISLPDGMEGDFEYGDCRQKLRCGENVIGSVVRMQSDRSSFGPLLPSAVPSERTYIWPGEYPMPYEQPHQIAAKSEDVSSNGFVQADHRRPYIDWYVPPTSNRSDTCILVLSGGGFYSCCDAARLQPAIDRFVRAGVTVANLTYRTPRPNGLPIYQTAWADAQRAVRVVRSQAAARGYSADRIGATGISAGAKVALLLALSSRTPAYDRIDALDDLSARLAFAIPQAPAYVLTDGACGENTREGEAAEIVDELAFDGDTAPLCCLHGGADRYSPIASVRLYQRLLQRGVPAELHLFADRWHGFHGDANRADDGTAWDHWCDIMLDFIVQFDSKVWVCSRPHCSTRLSKLTATLLSAGLPSVLVCGAGEDGVEKRFLEEWLVRRRNGIQSDLHIYSVRIDDSIRAARTVEYLNHMCVTPRES